MLTLDAVPIVPSQNTIHERWEIDCAGFEALKRENWYINKKIEPDTWDRKSILTQWLLEIEGGGSKNLECRVPLMDQAGHWCHKRFSRPDRAIAHVRTHLGHKPYLCEGYPNCKQEGWYVIELMT